MRPVIDCLRKAVWWVRGHLEWQPTEAWIRGNERFGDLGSYSHVPQKRYMSAWEWWTKWSNINGG